MPKPSPESHPVYFQKYIDLVAEDDLSTAFSASFLTITKFLHSINEAKSTYSYAPGKWTLKEMMQHIIDTERIFAYRALCIARAEKENLPGFDENEYAANSHANLRTWKDLADEYMLVRKSTELLFNSFTDETLQNRGSTNNKPTSVASLGFIAVGHVYHHINMYKQKYV